MNEVLENADSNMIPMTPAKNYKREKSSVIADLGIERYHLNLNINKLKEAIAADPENVSASQKALWGSQLDAMQKYKDALSARIIDLIDSDK